MGFVAAALRQAPCCASPPGPPLPTGRVVFDGLITAWVVGLITFGFAVLLTRRPAAALFLLGMFIATLDGLLLSRPAYLLGNPFFGIFFGWVLGALLGWLVCRLLCREAAGAPTGRQP